MATLNQDFIAALPTSAENLTPNMVGSTISYAGQRVVTTKTVPAKDLHFLETLLDGNRAVDIIAGSFNSLFFVSDKTTIESLDEKTISAVGNTLASVIDVVETQPKWIGAAKGASGINKDGVLDFSTYKIVGYRIKTYDGQPSFRSTAYADYEAVKLASITDKTPMNMQLLKYGGVKKNIPTGFLEHLTYEFLLQEIK